ncbi:MAG: alpha/beta hydrolase [Bacteroidia bacterium]|nr:alpha/beta hydrolase [Bacteroidia bacterium]NNJ55847.1 alpha/beta hydrolase [Bacteroidia bacterium]
MKQLLFYIGLSIFLSSCLDLDENLFNPDTSISEYQFDDFEGIQEIDVSEYTIPQDSITLFTLEVGTNGEKIYATYVGDISRIGLDTVILYCHGNAGHMDFYWPRTKLLANVGGLCNYGVLTFDYRGYGLSEGKPSEDNMYEDSDAAIQWLKDQGLNDDRFMMYGFSLGAAAVCELTANPRTIAPSKIMLESPFASADVMVQDGSGLSLPKSFFVNLEIDNAEEIKKISQPFYWIHGTIDDFLDINTHGEVVYKNYQGTYSEAHRIVGANHADVPLVMGFEAYIESLKNFITLN